MKSDNTFKTILILIIGLVAGMAVYHFMLAGQTTGESAIEHAQKHLDPDYVCPMHPEVVSDKAGSCPICGMELVVQEHEADNLQHDADYPAIRISPTTRHNYGIRVANTEKRTLIRTVTAPGFVRSIRSGKRYNLTAPVNGKVVDAPVGGQTFVNKGDVLLSMVSQLTEDLQQQHLALMQQQALENEAEQQAQDDEETPQRQTDDADKPTDLSMLLEQSRQRLLQAGLNQSQIQQIEKTGEIITRFDLLAPDTGTVIPLQKTQAGDVLSAGDKLMMMQANARITVVADAVQRDIAWIENGYPAELTIPHAPGRTWPGNVSQKASLMSSSARTIGVRFAFSVPQELVQSSMYVKATVRGDRHDNVLSVPRDALIRYENQTRVVKLLDDGRFQPVIITTGIESGDYVEVRSGLDEGDRVVVSGQFLLDSESNLQAGFRRMSEQ